MEDGLYWKMYACLFNRVTHGISVLEQEGEWTGKHILIRGQIEVEEMYLAAGGENGD